MKRHLALSRATRFLGFKEESADSNQGPYDPTLQGGISYWQRRTNGVTGYPWCAAFVYNMFLDVHVDLKERGLKLPSWVVDWVRWGRASGYEVLRPLKGDVVCFDWNEDQTRDHMGFVEKVLALRWRGKRFVGYIRTIEGNTAAGNDSNGGQVQRRWRWVNSSTVFLRIPD